VSPTLIRGAALVASPWKNGGGITREVASCAYEWRVSIADIDRDGPFSRFDGIDRTLVLLSGAGMTLTEAGGARHVLDAPLARADFAGETAIDATLHDGPTRDFNLMTRRSAARGTVDVWRAGTHRVERADTVLLFCASGAVGVEIDGAHYALQEMDTLRLDGPRRAFDVVVSGGGALLAVSLAVGARD